MQVVHLHVDKSKTASTPEEITKHMQYKISDFT